MFIGSRDFCRGEKAAVEIGDGAIMLQLEITDAASITSTAERIRKEAGRLDVLVNNAAISTTRVDVDMAELRAVSKASTAPLEDVRAV